jgi:hypothetical protein
MSLTQWMNAVAREAVSSLSRIVAARRSAYQERQPPRARRAAEVDRLERRDLLAAAPMFNPQITLASGIRPMAVVVADFNGDRKADLAIVNSGDNDIAIALGNGDGTFQAQTTFAVGLRPDFVAVADFNHDNKLDLVVSNSGAGTVSVLLGNGDGSFAPQTTLAVGNNPVFVAAIDVNHDANSDILVANKFSGTVGVLLGNGNGTFAAQHSYATGALPNGLTVADVNGDGKSDLIVANYGAGNANVSVLLGNGDGSFQTQQTFTAGGPATSVAAADLNDDTKPDLIAVSPTSASVSVLTNNGSGGFTSHQTFAAAITPMVVTIADINGDGTPDVVVAGSSFTNNKAAVLLGNGDGTLQAPLTFPIDGIAYDAVVADVNGDGTPDFVTANYGGNDLSILLAVPIAKSDATIVVSGAIASFDGNPHAATATATGTAGENLDALLHLTYQDKSTGVVASIAPTAIGTYEVFASFDGNVKYNPVASFDTGKTVIIGNQSPIHPILAGRLPIVSLVAGQKIRPIREVVTLVNAGSTPFSGTVTVNLILSTDAAGTSGGPVVGTLSKKVKLSATRVGALGVVLIKSLPAGTIGTFHLVAQLTDNAGGTTATGTTATLSIAAPRIDLAAISVKPPPLARIGKRLQAVLTLLQAGNIPIAGNVPVQLFLSTSQTVDAGSIDLGTVAGHASILAGRKGVLRLTATIPSSVTAGQYFVIASVDPQNTLGDSNTGNNVVASAKMIAVK